VAAARPAHATSARMVADLLALDGWDELFVGADVPVDDLVRMVREVRPRVVALSITLPVNAPMARLAVRRVRDAAPGVKILAGGRASAEADLGADAIALRGSEAVEVARAWK
jgi:methanogenic corrinoid protein MtbC1